MKGQKNAVKFADAVLCYVDNSGAYFTTQKLSEQCGDYWNDAPYEHNAGNPYKPCWHNQPKEIAKRGGKVCIDRCCMNDWNEDGTPKWHIIFVEYCGDFQTPADLNPPNSHFSVEQINAGSTPWLTREYAKKVINIRAGATLRVFVDVIRKNGGYIHRVKVE